MNQKKRREAIRRLRPRSLYYDREGQPISMEEYAAAIESDEGRIVAVDKLDADVTISTVWLGIDHNWGRGEPIIFETMVFGGPHAGNCERYSTEQEAREGHVAMVAKLNAK